MSAPFSFSFGQGQLNSSLQFEHGSDVRVLSAYGDSALRASVRGGERARHTFLGLRAVCCIGQPKSFVCDPFVTIPLHCERESWFELVQPSSMHMLWHLLCTITAASHAQQYLDHRKTAATGVPHWHDAPPRVGDDLSCTGATTSPPRR